MATIRQATDRDLDALTALRRTWTEEQHGPVDDSAFADRFADWYANRAGRRITLLAELDGDAVGTMNLAIFERMPRPATPDGRWAYLGNAFVLAEHRGKGIGTALLDALLHTANELRCVRVVLSPSEKSVPFYQRAGFGQATMLMAKVLT